MQILVKLMDLFENESDELLASGQIKEILKNSIDSYTGADEEETA